jgi:hypothetical protein
VGECTVLLKKSEKEGMVRAFVHGGDWIELPIQDITWEEPQIMRDRKAFEEFMDSDEAAKIFRKTRAYDREFVIWQLSRANLGESSA